jgi:hypothetical protein
VGLELDGFAGGDGAPVGRLERAVHGGGEQVPEHAAQQLVPPALEERLGRAFT